MKNTKISSCQRQNPATVPNWKVVLGIKVARYVVQERSCWNSSGLGKWFWEFKWRGSAGGLGVQVAHSVVQERRFWNSSA